MSKLIVNNLTKSYSGRIVVSSVSLKVLSGQVVGLLGPNGAGKTTTFYIIVGLIKPDCGSVYLDGVDISRYPTHIRAVKGLGYLPQDSSIFAKLTVEENLMIILETLPLNYRERKNKVRKLLSDLNILKVANMRAVTLSGGEKRRLEIARALIIEPKVMLLDEPFAGVDPIAITDILDIIKHLRDRKIGILISDHNVRETLRVCDAAFIISDGKVVENGTPQKIIRSEVARRLYLGKKFEL